jgi:hypothetical protein
LVPPIIFEAALSIDKRSFNRSERRLGCSECIRYTRTTHCASSLPLVPWPRHLIPILMFAVVGTLVATFLTAVIVHYGTSALAGWCAPIPYVEAVSDVDFVGIIAVAIAALTFLP